MRLRVESILGNFLVDVKTFHEQIPESFVARRVGEASRHANDGNLIVLSTTNIGLLGFPSIVVFDGDVLLAACTQCGLQTVSNIGDAKSVNLAFGLAERSDLRDSFLQKMVPSYRLP